MAKYGNGVSLKEISRERIEILFAHADSCKDASPDLSARYVGHACEISAKQRTRLTKEEKRSFCHACGTYLVPGKTSRVRISRGRVIITCIACGHAVRIPLTKRHEEGR